MTTDNTNWKAVAEMQTALVNALFGYDLSKEVLLVLDGCVCKDSKVWWKGENGPDYVNADEHWRNIKEFPNIYSVKEPRYTVTYLE